MLHFLLLRWVDVPLDSNRFLILASVGRWEERLGVFGV